MDFTHESIVTGELCVNSEKEILGMARGILRVLKPSMRVESAAAIEVASTLFSAGVLDRHPEAYGKANAKGVRVSRSQYPPKRPKSPVAS
jgi:hypothetical protein